MTSATLMYSCSRLWDSCSKKGPKTSLLYYFSTYENSYSLQWKKTQFYFWTTRWKKNCENQKKINRQLVMSRTSLTIKHVEIGRRINGTLRLSYKNPNFSQDLTRFFQKGRVIAKSRLTSTETCYLYGRLTSHLRYVQGCLNHWHFETW